MGDPQEQERRLQEATQASLANLVRTDTARYKSAFIDSVCSYFSYSMSSSQIMKKKVSLQKAFEEYDQGNTDIIAIDAWCEVGKWRLHSLELKSDLFSLADLPARRCHSYTTIDSESSHQAASAMETLATSVDAQRRQKH